MMIFVWIALAFFAGLALLIVTPWTAAKMAGDDWEEYVSGVYVWLAQTAATKSAIVERDGTLELVSKRYDSEILADKDKEHGDPRHHSDGFSVLSRLKNKSFGVALHGRAEYVSPLLAELGEKAWQARETDQIGKSGDGKMRDGITVEKTSKLVDLARARHLTTGDADPEDGHESYLWTEISQEGFNEKLSFGQTMVIVIGALGSMVAMFYLTSQTGGTGGAPAPSPPAGGNNTTTVSTLVFLATLSGFGLDRVKSAFGKLRDAITPGGSSDEEPADADSETMPDINLDEIGEDDQDADGDSGDDAGDDSGPSIGEQVMPALRKLGAVAWIIGWIVTWPLTALLLEGLVTALLVAIVMTGVALVIPVGISLLGPSIPKSVGLILARGLWILAQLTVGRGVVVRRETGEYEHHKLYTAGPDADHDAAFETELSDGTTLPVKGSEGDLYRFGWAPLGVTEEKGAANMGPITQDTEKFSDVQADGGRIAPKNTRQGYRPLLQIPDKDKWLVTLPQLWSWCQGTSESTTIEQGRDKALSEHGGNQQIGMAVFSVVVLMSVVVGGAFGFIAAGGLG